MKHGPAWIILEESYHKASRRLISILSPRRTPRDVTSFMEQAYVDRHSSIEERLRYKKSRRTFPYAPMIEGHVIHCGHDPIFVGIYAQSTLLQGRMLSFSYRIIVRRGNDPRSFEFEERQQSLEV